MLQTAGEQNLKKIIKSSLIWASPESSNIRVLNETSALINLLALERLIWHSISIKLMVNLQQLLCCDKQRKCSFD